MRKSLLFIAGILFNAAFVSAQTPTHRCGTDEVMHELFEQDPAAKQRYEDNLRKLNQDAEAAQEARNRKIQAAKVAGVNPEVLGVYPLDTIPVVFHVLHQYGPENIPDQTLINALAQVNKDYQKLDADTSTIDVNFSGIAGAANIIFALAKLDPSGNCTNGIVRHYDANTNWNRTTANGNGWNNYNYSGTAPGNWDPRKYLNTRGWRPSAAPAGSPACRAGSRCGGCPRRRCSRRRPAPRASAG